MTDDRSHDEVLDSLTYLQARLRGDPASPHPTPPAWFRDALLEGTGLTVSDGDVEVTVEPEPQLALVTQLRPPAERVSALAERLARVEHELDAALGRIDRVVEDSGSADRESASEARRVRKAYGRASELQDLAKQRLDPSS